MGQVAVKIKQMVERLEWNNNTKSSLSKSLYTSTTDLDLGLHGKEKQMLSKVLNKLELIEKVVEGQSHILGDQEAKLRALESTVQHAHDALESLKQPSTSQSEEHKDSTEEDTTLNKMFSSIFQDKTPDDDKAELTEPSQVLQEHAQTLKNHEERLKTAIERIQNIWDVLNKGPSSSMNDIHQELKQVKKLVESLRKNHDALKSESHDELQLQQKLLDNLFSGFVVAFLLLVFICMFHK